MERLEEFERVNYGNGHKKNRSRLLAHIKTGHFRKAFKFTCAICGKSQGTWTGSMVIKSVGCQNKMDFIFWEKLMKEKVDQII